MCWRDRDAFHVFACRLVIRAVAGASLLVDAPLIDAVDACVALFVWLRCTRRRYIITSWRRRHVTTRTTHHMQHATHTLQHVISNTLKPITHIRSGISKWTYMTVTYVTFVTYVTSVTHVTASPRGRAAPNGSPAAEPAAAEPAAAEPVAPEPAAEPAAVEPAASGSAAPATGACCAMHWRHFGRVGRSQSNVLWEREGREARCV